MAPSDYAIGPLGAHHIGVIRQRYRLAGDGVDRSGYRRELEREGPQTEPFHVEGQRPILNGRTAQVPFLAVHFAGGEDRRGGKCSMRPVAGLPVNSFRRTTTSSESLGFFNEYRDFVPGRC